MAQLNSIEIKVSDSKPIKQLIRAIADASHSVEGGCWCDYGVGNPMYKSHSPQCEALRQAVADLGASKAR